MNMLDHLTAASRGKWSHPESNVIDYWHRHRRQLAPAFDLWLVKMNDPLAYQAGTPESRFIARALSFANNPANRPDSAPASARGARTGARTAGLNRGG